MNRDKFANLILTHCEPSPMGDDAGEEILAEYDRLTAIKDISVQLVEYRRRNNALSFQLEKADDYIHALEIAIEEAEESK